GDERDRGHEGDDDHVMMAEMADLMGEDRSDLILVQLLEERLRHDEFRGGDRATEDERVRRGILAHPDPRHRYARLARELLDRLMEPGIRLRRDGLPAADRPPDDVG